MLHLGVISVIPEILAGLSYGVIGRAIEQGLVKLDCWNPRQWTTGPHRQVDDKPYGGGAGMVMMYEPLQAALKHARQAMPDNCKTIYLSPQGRTIRQAELNVLANQEQALLFLAGRYEGIDERVVAHHVDEEWSLGDFVLSGGELAAMVFIDALVRLLPGCLGHQASVQQDSFMNGLLDYPHYTRPAYIDGYAVPDVLLNGNHQDIAQWRRKQALGKTWLKRPDLLKQVVLTKQDLEWLVEFKQENI